MSHYMVDPMWLVFDSQNRMGSVSSLKIMDKDVFLIEFL